MEKFSVSIPHVNKPEVTPSISTSSSFELVSPKGNWVGMNNPTLLMDATRDTFYPIRDDDNPSGLTDGILEQLYSHQLLIALPAAVARWNEWDVKRLAGEWERSRTRLNTTTTSPRPSFRSPPPCSDTWPWSPNAPRSGRILLARC